jgi:peptidoglycan/xylan/chitin deacetylase (PgdA/CDA1 family)
VDWRPHHTPAIIQDRVLRRIMPGAIVLIHPTERTVQALPPLLAQLRRRGYRLLTVSQLLAQSPSPARRPAAASAGEDG